MPFIKKLVLAIIFLPPCFQGRCQINGMSFGISFQNRHNEDFVDLFVGDSVSFFPFEIPGGDIGAVLNWHGLLGKQPLKISYRTLFDFKYPFSITREFTRNSGTPFLWGVTPKFFFNSLAISRSFYFPKIIDGTFIGNVHLNLGLEVRSHFIRNRTELEGVFALINENEPNKRVENAARDVVESLNSFSYGLQAGLSLNLFSRFLLTGFYNRELRGQLTAVGSDKLNLKKHYVVIELTYLLKLIKSSSRVDKGR